MMEHIITAQMYTQIEMLSKVLKFSSWLYLSVAFRRLHVHKVAMYMINGYIMITTITFNMK